MSLHAAFIARSALGCVALFAAMSTSVNAQGKGPAGYPLKSIRFMVPFAPGGTTDIISRMVSQRLSEELGQPLVVDNRGGAGGTIAAEIVARAAGDGYTLIMNHQGMTFNATLYKKLPFNTEKDFAAISLVGVTPNVLVVNTALPVKSVKEFVGFVKTKELSYGSGGVGSSAHIAVELFERLAGIKLLHVPYKGAGPALADTLAGQVQMMIATMPAAAGFVRAGKLRALGVSGAKRSPAFPDLPTIAESGVPGYDYDTWYGVLGPASMPRAMVQWLNATVNRVVTEQPLRDRLAETGLEVDTGTPERFQKIVSADIVRWGKLIKEAGIRIE
ncbi:MAG: tripartite tricarboxylate transporter substrate binding protein [Proteobacteria bacterium]|nr:tripartite tricarboxylate transporter substrate binding protein [Burkholderiales bacterium]